MTPIEKLVEAARKTLRVVGWSPSRFGKWRQCPQKVLLEDLMKMCPVCFRGRISGGFDGEPVVCDTCVKDQPERAPLERGNRLDAALTSHLSGAPVEARVGQSLEERAAEHVNALAESTRHPKVEALVKKLRKTKNVHPQESIVLDSKWNRVGQYTRGAWARLKLDVLHLTPKAAHVIDWKSGNIDKKTGEIRAMSEYNDAMLSYQIAVLSCYPQPEATAKMVFLDAPPRLEDPTKTLVPLKRKDLAQAQRDWEKKIAPMMSDTVFAPRPGFYCSWCPFQRAKGGPCKF